MGKVPPYSSLAGAQLPRARLMLGSDLGVDDSSPAACSGGGALERGALERLQGYLALQKTPP